MSAYSKIETLGECYRLLAKRRLPTLFVIGERDGIIPRRCSYDICQFLGANENENYFIYDEQNNLIKEPENSSTNWLKVIIFKGGGHLSFVKLAPIVNEYLKNMIDNIDVIEKAKKRSNN